MPCWRPTRSSLSGVVPGRPRPETRQVTAQFAVRCGLIDLPTAGIDRPTETFRKLEVLMPGARRLLPRRSSSGSASVSACAARSSAAVCCSAASAALTCRVSKAAPPRLSSAQPDRPLARRHAARAASLSRQGHYPPGLSEFRRRKTRPRAITRWMRQRDQRATSESCRWREDSGATSLQRCPRAIA
jgi:hypothetical protein